MTRHVPGWLRLLSFCLIPLLGSVTTPSPALAQGAGAEESGAAEESGTAEDTRIPDLVLARMAENPTAGIARIPIVNATQVGVGPGENVANATILAPIIPVHLENHWGLLTRTTIPALLSFPVGDDRVNGFGDIGFELFVHKQLRGKRRFYDIIFGPSVRFPSASDPVLGSGRYLLAPEVGFAYTGGQWVSVLIAQNFWSVGEADGRADVNRFELELLLFYNLPKLIYLVYEPTITANWNAPQGNRWTFPVGLGVGRHHYLPRRRRLALTTRLSLLYNAVRPDNAARWQVTALVSLWHPNASIFDSR